MLTSSKKAKGHLLEKLIQDKLTEHFSLDKSDIRISIGSENGEDVKLSDKARNKLPIKIEAKSRKSIAVYSWFSQAEKHQGDHLQPVLIIKQNRCKPLCVISLDYFIELIKKGNNNERSKAKADGG